MTKTVSKVRRKSYWFSRSEPLVRRTGAGGAGAGGAGGADAGAGTGIGGSGSVGGGWVGSAVTWVLLNDLPESVRCGCDGWTMLPLLPISTGSGSELSSARPTRGSKLERYRWRKESWSGVPTAILETA